MSLIYQADALPGRKTRPSLYIGGKEDAKDLDKLKRWNVTHILNVTPAKHGTVQAGVANYFEKQFAYKRIPVLDNPTSATDFAKQADGIVEYIVTGLCHGSVFVHCQHGVSRSTTAILFYLMRRVGMSLTEGLTLIQRRRPKAQPIPAFIAILNDFEANCRELEVSKTKTKSTTTIEEPSKRKAVVGPVMPPPEQKRARPIGPALPPPSNASQGEAEAKEPKQESSDAATSTQDPSETKASVKP